LLAGIHGLPTTVVTLWASIVALKRALLTVIGLLEAMLSVAEVTRGVMLQGATPEMESESGVALLLLLMATTTTVPSAGLTQAESRTPDGAVPEVESRMVPGRANREKLPMIKNRLVHTFV